MEIYAKSALDSREIQEKIECGCDAIELQLLSDFMRNSADFLNVCDERLLFMKDIRVVHAPIYKNGRYMTLESALLHEDITPLLNTFSLAQRCGEIWRHTVLVVLHCALSYEDFMDYELLLNRTKSVLSDLFTQNPFVDLGIENVIPLEYGFRDGNLFFQLCNGCYTDTVYITEKLADYFGKRVGSVLDICHAGMTQKYMNALLKEAEMEFDRNMEYDISSYFKEFKNTCKLIHFNSFSGNGYKKNHGTGFADKEKMEQVLSYYWEYQYTVPITLELREDDYHNCINYRKQREWVLEICKGKTSLEDSR